MATGRSAPDDATVVLLDDHHGGPRRHAVDEVRPARRRVGEGRFSLEARIGLGAVCRGVLHGDEQCRGVRRETRAAEFGANRAAEEHLALSERLPLWLETPAAGDGDRLLPGRVSTAGTQKTPGGV